MKSMNYIFAFFLLVPHFLLAHFTGHYDDWRNKRVIAIVDHYGPEWFEGKAVLEVGCGYADIGNYFYQLGADVTVSEARAEHCAEIARRYPHLKIIQCDLDGQWMMGNHYDLIIHMGTLYHLRDPVKALYEACTRCDHLVLETECSDSSDPNYCLFTSENGFDQAYNGIGCRPSPAYVERVLKTFHFDFDIITDNRCNSDYHIYDWPITNSGTWKHGQRRFWFCQSTPKQE